MLLIKYIVEENKELQDKTIAMNKLDFKCQWLMGNSLKQDQFKFMYDSIKIIYDSALKDLLLNEDKTIMESVIPKIVAYMAIM